MFPMGNKFGGANDHPGFGKVPVLFWLAEDGHVVHVISGAFLSAGNGTCQKVPVLFKTFTRQLPQCQSDTSLLQEQSWSNGPVSIRDVDRKSAFRRFGTMSRWQLRFQPEPERDLFPPWGCLWLALRFGKKKNGTVE